MSLTTDHEGITRAWLAAGVDLGIDVVAPFTLIVDGQARTYLALVPHFGGGKGTVVAALPYAPVLAVHAKKADYRPSFVAVESYDSYRREHFIDTLMEWGFTGPTEKRPSWLAATTESLRS